jgi:hypothetical protein
LKVGDRLTLAIDHPFAKKGTKVTCCGVRKCNRFKHGFQISVTFPGSIKMGKLDMKFFVETENLKRKAEK